MLHRFTIPSHERALLHVDGVPTAYLGPGRHWVFRPLARVELVRFSVDKLAVDLRPEQAALAPPGEVRVLQLASHERAVVHARGKPALWLGPGRHVLFTLDPALAVEVLDTRGNAITPLDAEVRKIAAAADYLEVTVPEGAVGLRYVDGRLDNVLPPGRHAAWKTVHQVNIAVVETRERQLAISGQEVMTKDRVSLRLNVTVEFQVADPRKLATVAREADDALYLAVQLVTRDAVTSRTLDGLLSARDALALELRQGVAARAAELGLRVVTLGLKDMILPGEIRELMNKVMEAQKAAEANVIARREEIAATKALAQTAEVLREHPVLLRLKELEAYGELAGKVGQLHLVLGDGALPQLQLRT
ncbi:MAG: slipin family protein [Deltaproteobacteria bacterium]|nr:slipin family protein [Deltaproteobacteria bacterium]